MLFEGHMSCKQLPDTYVGLRVFLVFLGHLFRELKLVSKGLVEECHNKGVLGNHQYLWRVQFVYRFTLVFQLLYGLLNYLLKTVVWPKVTGYIAFAE